MTTRLLLIALLGLAVNVTAGVVVEAPENSVFRYLGEDGCVTVATEMPKDREPFGYEIIDVDTMQVVASSPRDSRYAREDKVCSHRLLSLEEQRERFVRETGDL